MGDERVLKSKLSPSRKLKPLSFLVVNFNTTEAQREHSLVSYSVSCYGAGVGVGVGAGVGVGVGAGVGVGVGVSSVMISSGSGMRAGMVSVP